MARPPTRYPTDLELLILKVLWRSSPLPVRDVQASLAREGRKLARTSVITTLNTMVAKKYLIRRKQANSYFFAPRITEEEVTHRVLGDMLDRVFDGSTSAVLLKLFDVTQVQTDELQELRRIIDRKLKEG